MAAYLEDVEEAHELRFVVRVALDVAGGGGREEDGACEGSAGFGGGVAVEHGGGEDSGRMTEWKGLEVGVEGGWAGVLVVRGRGCE